MDALDNRPVSIRLKGLVSRAQVVLLVLIPYFVRDNVLGVFYELAKLADLVTGYGVFLLFLFPFLVLTIFFFDNIPVLIS